MTTKNSRRPQISPSVTAVSFPKLRKSLERARKKVDEFNLQLSEVNSALGEVERAKITAMRDLLIEVFSD